MIGIRTLLAGLMLSSQPLTAAPKELRTNCCLVQNPPAWLQTTDLQATAKRVEGRLQWTIRRVQLRFVQDPNQYRSEGSLQFPTRAFFNRSKNTIYFSPTVNKDNFPAVLGHELVHVVFAQKHKHAIPVWLEEGFANFIGSQVVADYRWLAKEQLSPVTSLKHPNSDPDTFRQHYQLSGAAVDYIASRCSLDDLLMMSVKRSVTDYLQKLCRIKNIDSEVAAWIASKASL
jgi:hypothetical protein